MFIDEVPGKGIKIIFFMTEADLQVVGQDIRYFIKAFQATIVIYDGFSAAEIGA